MEAFPVPKTLVCFSFIVYGVWWYDTNIGIKMCVWMGWMKGRGFICCESSVLSMQWSFLDHITQVEVVFIEQKKKWISGRCWPMGHINLIQFYRRVLATYFVPDMGNEAWETICFNGKRFSFLSLLWISQILQSEASNFASLCISSKCQYFLFNN